MKLQDRLAAVARMQRYIDAHYADEIAVDALCRISGYSKFHALRISRQLTGVSPGEAIRALRLTDAARSLRDTDKSITDAALDAGFRAPESFTRAFERRFGISPAEYRRAAPPVGYFIHYPVEDQYILKEAKSTMTTAEIFDAMTVTAVERPARRLILRRARQAAAADGYLAVCAELGCDWEGLLASIPERLHGPALLTLPENMRAAGATDAAVGTEVPLDYCKPLPEGYEYLELPPCVTLYFRGPRFSYPNAFPRAIGVLWAQMDKYDPALYGFEYAPELAPYSNFGAEPETGALMARPARKI